MKSEAQGIIQALYQELTPTVTYQGMRMALQDAQHQLSMTSQLDSGLIRQLTDCLTYTIFTQCIRLTPTENLLVSELLSLSHRLDAQTID